MSKKSFYCWYLGFTEAYGQQGQNRVYDLLKNLVNYQNNKSDAIAPSKVTLHLSEKSMTLIDSTQVLPNNNKKNRKLSVQAKDQKTYIINYDSITFVGRLADQQFTDVLTCIVKNINPITQVSTFYLHAFRCDSEETSKKMEQYLNYFRRLYFKKIEKHQQKQKENFIKQNSRMPAQASDNMFMKKPTTNTNSNSNLKENFIKRQMFKITDHFQNSNSSGGTRSSTSQNEISYQSPMNSPPTMHLPYHYKKIPVYESTERAASPKNKIYDDIHREITGKLQAGEPFLYPPKDYTEENRKRGNLSERENRRCLNEKIVGEQALKIKNQPIQEDYEPESELYLNLSSTSVKNETEVNTSRSVDFNSLSFNEQANQVLNYFDEIVDSVDSIYKPPIPIDSNRNIYKFEPPEENSFQTTKKSDDFYEPYEPLTDHVPMKSPSQGPKIGMLRDFNDQHSKYVKKNPLQASDGDQMSPRNKQRFNSPIKRTPAENPYFKVNQNEQKKTKNNFRKSKSQVTSARESEPGVAHADVMNIGIRNPYPVLGNYTPKMYANGMASATTIQGSNQVIYRRLDNNENLSNKENIYQKMHNLHAASDEFIYKKKSQNSEIKNYDMILNNSLTDMNPDYDDDQNLKRTVQNEPNQNADSQFILKPASGKDYTNYVHVENVQNFQSLESARTVINIDSNYNRQSRKTGNTSKSYDIYY